VDFVVAIEGAGIVCLEVKETVRFWEHNLPLQMADLAAELEPGHRFDAIVVDEAQDFADAWWDPLLAALKDDETGDLYVFIDEGQRVLKELSSVTGLVPATDKDYDATRAAVKSLGNVVGDSGS